MERIGNENHHLHKLFLGQIMRREEIIYEVSQLLAEIVAVNAFEKFTDKDNSQVMACQKRLMELIQMLEALDHEEPIGEPH